MPDPATWDDLAAALGVSVRNFHRWRKVPGAPTGLSIEEWRQWMAANGKGQASATDIGDGELPGDCDYDQPVRTKVISLSDALKREQVKEQMIINDTRAVELEKAREEAAIRRGKLFTKEQVDARDSRVADVLLSQLASVEAAMVGVADVAKRDDARAKAKAWITDVRNAIGAALKDLK